MPKSTASSSQPTSDYSIIEIEDENETEASSTFNQQTRPSKRNWIWAHFTESKDGTELICHVTKKDGTECLKKMKKDKTGSTGNYSDHLLRVHKLENPQSAQSQRNQRTLTSYVNKKTPGSKMQLQVCSMPLYFLKCC